MTASAMITVISHFVSVHYTHFWGQLRLEIRKQNPKCCKTQHCGWQLVKVGLTNYSSHLALGKEKKLQSSLLMLFMSNYYDMTGWAIPQISVEYDSRHPLTDALTFLLCFFFLRENVSAAAYQRPQTYIMKLNWASTAIKPHLQYQHSILQIIHSLPWILQTIRTLPRDWGNGSI